MPGIVPVDPDSEPDANLPRWKAKRRVLESEERVEAERKIAKECIHRLLEGESAYALSVELNARGATGERAALPVSGKRWRRETLLITLCRPVMAGLLVHNGEIAGKLADIEPVVDQQVWELLVAKTAARKTGRPPVARHMLTGTIRCGRCGVPLKVYVRSNQKPYSDGSPRREYRCPSPNSSVAGLTSGCGRNSIDALIAEQAVAEAVVTRLRDPRHVEIVAEEMQQARSRRAEIADKIRQAENEADQLSAKVRTWGVRRVDNAMRPILREIEALQQELAQFDDVALVGASAEYAIAKWEQACADGDVEAQRETIRHAFPRLVLAPRSRIGDHNVTRLLWDGTFTSH